MAEAFGRYGAHLPAVKVLPIYGGSLLQPCSCRGLRRGRAGGGRDAGPGHRPPRDAARLDLSRLDYLVLDEADEMLQMGFAEDVERILADTPEYKQVALFSATMPPAIRKITTKYLHDAVEVTVTAKTTTAENITQRYIEVAGPRKMDALTRVLEVEPFEAMIVFVRTKQATEEVAEKLKARGFSAAAINGDIPQAQRERTIGALKNGSIDILVATDVAARGLDVERISHVLNYDIPHDTGVLRPSHRSDRPRGPIRIGAPVRLATRAPPAQVDREGLRDPRRFTEAELPTVDDVNAQRVAKFRDSITDALDEPGFDLFRSLIRTTSARTTCRWSISPPHWPPSRATAKQFLMTEPPPEKRRPRDRDDRPARQGPTDRKPRKGFATYRISVGKRHKVGPGHIVGAIANEGGLHRSDFGHITIRPDFSLVELPAKLPQENAEGA